MDHRFQQQNASDRSRYVGGFARRRIGQTHVEGNGQFGNQMSSSKIRSDSISRNGSPLERHSLVSESRKNSSKKASGTPIRTLIHEEISREKKANQSSPSVIAKLMGLDSLPPPQIVNQHQKETRSYLPKSTYASRKDHSLQLSTSEHQEFKDVFEIKDSVKFEKHKNQPFFKGNLRMKQDDTDVAFIRQKFMEAKRLSTDESLQNSKEFNDALEILDSNKDLFLKFLEEPNSLFTKTKHLHDLKGFSPPPGERNITVLKSSRNETYEIDEVSSKSAIKTERCTQMQKDAITSLRKPGTNLFNHLLKEHSGSLSHKLLKSRSAGKTSPGHRSTRIVVLKPNLEKAQDMPRNVSRPSSHDSYPSGYKRHKEFQNSGIHELHAEGIEHHNLFDNLEVAGQRTKGSREIAREITKQMKRSVSSGSDKMLVSGLNRHIKDEHSRGLPGMYDLNNSEAHHWTQDNFDYWNRASSPSTSCSTESSVSREARKRLSEHWRMINQLQEARFVGRESSTLGEMLALPDRVVQRDIQGSFPVQQISDDKLARSILGKPFCHSVIISKDGLKDQCSRKLPRSSSSPASSSVHGTSKSSRLRVSDGDSCCMLKDVLNLGMDDSFGGNLNQRRSSSRKSFKLQSQNPHLNPTGEENKLPVREIHVNQEELKNGIHVSDPDPSEAKLMLSKLSESNIAYSTDLADSPVTESMDAEMPPITSEKYIQQPVQKGESSGINHIDEIIEEALPDHPQADSVPFPCGGEGPESLIKSKDAEQPSPVSVLEHPSEEGESSPECFERVSADLQGLRMQLQLLRLESDNYNRECESPILSEDGTGEYNSPPKKGDMLQTYRSEEDRDCSYLLDMLIDLGVHGAHQDSLLNIICSLRHPPGDQDTFENLEKKYGVLVEWSKSERKLLFDLVSSILAENPSLCMDQKPWLKPRRKLSPVCDTDGLVEDVWQMVVRLRKELSQGKTDENILDPRWLDLGDDVDTIGREMEGILEDELLEELVYEFLLD